MEDFHLQTGGNKVVGKCRFYGKYAYLKGMYISYIPDCCDKIPALKQLEGGKVCFSLQLEEMQTIVLAKTWQLTEEAGRSHSV